MVTRVVVKEIASELENGGVGDVAREKHVPRGAVLGRVDLPRVYTDEWR